LTRPFVSAPRCCHRISSRLQLRLEGLHYIVQVPATHGGLTNLPKELWHIASSVVRTVLRLHGHTETLHVLRGMRSVFRPGTATLVLGSPGSGEVLLLNSQLRWPSTWPDPRALSV
jgi:hypothetical protein